MNVPLPDAVDVGAPRPRGRLLHGETAELWQAFFGPRFADVLEIGGEMEGVNLWKAFRALLLTRKAP